MKSMKKLVLAGLVLLASVVVLAGCKNDSVPEVPKYTVKFDKNAEDATGEMAPQTFTQGEKKELTANAFVRPTWTFSGWSENKDATTPEYKDKAEFTTSKDTTLYAVWTDNGTVSPVTFDPSSTKLYYGETVTVTLSTTTEGARIHYQLGEEEWEIYEKPFTVSSETVVTAYATKDGLKDSEKTKSNYLRQLLSITVTPPTRTVYSVGESFDSTGMVVTATYEDGETREVTGWTTNFDEVTREKGVNKKVTVSYTEGKIKKQSSFTVVVFPEGVKILTDYTSPNHTDNSWTYVEFGEWPQSETEVVNPVLDTTQPEGLFKGKYYSDGNSKYVKEGDKFYKVEPIVWRILNRDYAETGTALLLAENILTGGIKWADFKNNYQESNIRKWLNGNSSDAVESDFDGDAGFLQTAFTEEARDQIADTEVDNSARSTNPDGNAGQWNSGENPYVCANTKDKIFLLSEQEATKEDYGFAKYNEYGAGNTRIRFTTDYAKATGTNLNSTTGYGWWWWLRSPRYDYDYSARFIYRDGDARSDISNVNFTNGGVVPALSISLQ
ncbi:MAG: InlB B-repeat-containing protein [Treponema sp.]|nr:InlB B-repeat-containing protein [Treponema sp.]